MFENLVLVCVPEEKWELIDTINNFNTPLYTLFLMPIFDPI